MDFKELADELRLRDAQYIVEIQNLFQPYETFLEILSVYFSPGKLVLYALPLMGVISMPLLIKSALAIGISNLLGNLLKWILPMSRPYWWVHEHNGPELRQHPLTCETSSGFPSGHTMTITVLLYIVVHHGTQCLKLNQPKCSSIFSILGDSFIAFIIIMMSVSRAYFACHFFYQCIAGATFGISLAKYLNEPQNLQSILCMQRSTGFMILMGLSAIIIGVCLNDIWNQKDPMWSVKMGFKWCERIEYLSHDSSPVYSTFKDLGFAVGIVLSLPLVPRMDCKLCYCLSIPLLIAICAINVILNQHTPVKFGREVFFTYGFARNCLYSYSLLKVLPKLSGIN